MRSKKTIISLLVLAFIGTTLWMVWPTRTVRRRKPITDGRYNVLLVTLDTTRADRLGCYGYSRNTSPNLDALANDAVRFDSAISASAVTPMSHASILTGLYPFQHGLRVFYGMTGYFLSDSVPTLAGILRDRGWRTAAFISAYPASERFGLHWGFEVFESEVAESVMERDPRMRPPEDGRWLRQRSGLAQRRADATTDQALDWLDDAENPFFMWVHYFDPHDVSLVPPEEYTERFDVGVDKSRALLDAYDAEIYFMDEQFGRLIDYLKDTGQYDSTVIMVIADHGQGLGDHNWFPHRLLYQEQIRLPFIARWPGGPHGVVESRLVRSIDVMPTILDVVNVSPAEDVEGESLLSLVAGKDQKPRFALAEALNLLDTHAPRELPRHQKDNLFCVVEAPWKLIYHDDSPESTELYYLDTDPHEQRNVINENPDVAGRLIERVKQSGIRDIEIASPRSPMDEETADKLRALGYLPIGWVSGDPAVELAVKNAGWMLSSKHPSRLSLCVVPRDTPLGAVGHFL